MLVTVATGDSLLAQTFPVLILYQGIPGKKYRSPPVAKIIP